MTTPAPMADSKRKPPRECEMCGRKAKSGLGAGPDYFWVCGIHGRYTKSRVPYANTLSRTEIRRQLGFIYPTGTRFGA